MSRIAGDEFAVLAVGAEGLEVAGIEAPIRQALKAPCSADPQPWPLSMSLGSSRFDSSAPTGVEGLMIEADQAIYHQQHSQGRAYHA